MSYKVAIGPQHSLQEITLMIQGEEAGASRFTDSVIRTADGALCNVATFETLDPGVVPPPITIVRHGDDPPAATQKVWEGVMLVTGNATAVEGYR